VAGQTTRQGQEFAREGLLFLDKIRHIHAGLAGVARIIQKQADILAESPLIALERQPVIASLIAARFAEVARAHWGIKTSLHWVLDVTMKED
jgi:predicted transposase YbfD/YdcC